MKYIILVSLFVLGGCASVKKDCTSCKIKKPVKTEQAKKTCKTKEGKEACKIKKGKMHKHM